jgi:hypothetical protein
MKTEAGDQTLDVSGDWEEYTRRKGGMPEEGPREFSFEQNET